MPIGFKKVLRKENGIFSRAFKLLSDTVLANGATVRAANCGLDTVLANGATERPTVDCPAAGSSKVADRQTDCCKGLIMMMMMMMIIIIIIIVQSLD
jgi:hypothetical protein